MFIQIFVYLFISLISFLQGLIHRKYFKKYIQRSNFKRGNILFLFWIPHFLVSVCIYENLNMAILAGVIMYLGSIINIVAVTGGISCGKSIVTEHLKDHYKFQIIDCDLISREIFEKNKPAYKQVVEQFGKKEILDQFENIDRKKLGAIVFENKLMMKKLTNITSYFIIIEILKKIIYYFYVQRLSLVVLDAPTLFESKSLEYICYPILVVYSSQEQQLQRLMVRDKSSIQDASNRINSQMSIQVKIDRADYSIKNNSSINNLIEQVNTFVKDFIL